MRRGAYLGIYDVGRFHTIWNNGFLLDLSVFGPTHRSNADGVLSFNSQSTYLLHRAPDRLLKPGLLFLTVGYSKFFINGSGVNYGSGVMGHLPRANSDFNAIRLEYRETFVPGWGRQPGFLMAWEGGTNTPGSLRAG